MYRPPKKPLAKPKKTPAAANNGQNGGAKTNP